MRDSQLVATNTFYQVLGKVITMSVTLLVTALVTRDLGEASYGQFTLIMGFAAFFYIISDFGSNAVVLKSYTESPQNILSELSTLLILRIIWSLFLIIVGLSLLFVVPYAPLVKLGILLSLLTIYTQALYTSFNSIFQYKLQYQRSTLALSVASLILLAWVVLVKELNLENRLLWYVGGYVTHGIILVVSSLYLAGKIIALKQINRPNCQSVRKLFRASLPLGLMLIFAQIHGKADIFLLSVLPLPEAIGLSSDETLGIYGLGYKIFEVVLVIATFLMNAVYPLMLMRLNSSWSALQVMYRKVVYLLLMLGVVGMTLLLVTAPLLVRIVAGQGFSEAVLTLRLLSLGLPAFFVSSAFQWYLVTTNQQKVLPVIYLMGALVTVVLNLIFIPQYSYLAAAVITWGVEYLILLLMVVWVVLIRREKIALKVYD